MKSIYQHNSKTLLILYKLILFFCFISNIEASEGQRRSLFIGQKNYTIGEKLEYTNEDAVEMRNILYYYGNFQESQLFTDGDKSDKLPKYDECKQRLNKKCILKIFTESVKKNKNSSDKFIFYFSGHGKLGELILTQATQNQNESIEIKNLIDIFETNSLGQFILILDSCRSHDGKKDIEHIDTNYWIESISLRERDKNHFSLIFIDKNNIAIKPKSLDNKEATLVFENPNKLRILYNGKSINENKITIDCNINEHKLNINESKMINITCKAAQRKQSIAIFYSTKGLDLSNEDKNCKHGRFTCVLLDNLKGFKDIKKDFVTLFDLKSQNEIKYYQKYEQKSGYKSGIFDDTHRDDALTFLPKKPSGHYLLPGSYQSLAFKNVFEEKTITSLRIKLEKEYNWYGNILLIASFTGIFAEISMMNQYYTINYTKYSPDKKDYFLSYYAKSMDPDFTNYLLAYDFSKYKKSVNLKNQTRNSMNNLGYGAGVLIFLYLFNVYDLNRYFDPNGWIWDFKGWNFAYNRESILNDKNVHIDNNYTANYNFRF